MTMLVVPNFSFCVLPWPLDKRKLPSSCESSRSLCILGFLVNPGDVVNKIFRSEPARACERRNSLVENNKKQLLLDHFKIVLTPPW